MANKPKPNLETCPEQSLRFGFELFRLFELLICIYLSIFCYIILQLAPKVMCIANIASRYCYVVKVLYSPKIYEKGSNHPQ